MGRSPETIQPATEAIRLPESTSLPFQVLDRLDGELIRKEIQEGEADHDPLVFAVEQNGRLIYDLNWKGVRQALRICAERSVASIAITNIPPQKEETDYHVQYTVFAVDSISGQTNWGVSREYKQGNPFAVQIALTKAQRNALRNLIPPEVKREIVRAFVDQGRAQGVVIPTIRSERQATEKPGTARQMARIQRDIEDLGVELKNVLDYYGVETLEQLSRTQASNAISLLSMKRSRAKSQE
jgi:hypothetical protein